MKISYQRSYPIGPFLQERIGFEIEAPDDGEPLTEIETLKQLCDEAHKKLNPNLTADYSDVAGHPQAEQQKPIPEVQTDSKEEQILGFVEAVQLCTSLTALNRFKTRVGELKDPRLTTAYEEKEKEFNNKKESAGNGGC